MKHVLSSFTAREPQHLRSAGKASIVLRRATGAAIEPWLDDIARLRIAALRGWPQLYAGDYAHEFRYLQTFLHSPFSIAVLVLDDDKLVGAATGLPLAAMPPTWLASLPASSLVIEEVFYFGESMLLPTYRGRGLGHRLFDEREAHVRALGGFAWTAFGAVVRAGDDPRRPPFHRDYEAFWRKRGYRPRAGVHVSQGWPEVPGGEPVAHTLDLWLRPLERL